jgi:hypothetical protein
MPQSKPTAGPSPELKLFIERVIVPALLDSLLREQDSGSPPRKCGRDGKKLVDLLYVLAVGTPEERREAFGEPVEVSAKDRRECIRELLDRGWGKSYAPRDENDVPLVADTPPQVVINLPRPQRELDHPAAVVVQDVLGPRRG